MSRPSLASTRNGLSGRAIIPTRARRQRLSQVVGEATVCTALTLRSRNRVHRALAIRRLRLPCHPDERPGLRAPEYISMRCAADPAGAVTG
jgi:hypothetical protein